MRAPWRWHWLRIVRLFAIWGLVGAALSWSSVLSVPLAIWLLAWVRAEYTEPLPRSEPEGVVTTIVAGHRVEERYNGVQTTITPEAVRTVRVDGG